MSYLLFMLLGLAGVSAAALSVSVNDSDETEEENDVAEADETTITPIGDLISTSNQPDDIPGRGGDNPGLGRDDNPGIGGGDNPGLDDDIPGLGEDAPGRDEPTSL